MESNHIIVIPVTVEEAGAGSKVDPIRIAFSNTNTQVWKIAKSLAKQLNLPKNKAVELRDKDDQEIDGEWTVDQLIKINGNNLVFFIKRLTLNEDGDVTYDEMSNSKKPTVDQNKVGYQI
jgi:hypothetical protein